MSLATLRNRKRDVDAPPRVELKDTGNWGAITTRKTQHRFCSQTVWLGGLLPSKQKKGGPACGPPLELRNSSQCSSEPFGSQGWSRQAQTKRIVRKRHSCVTRPVWADIAKHSAKVSSAKQRLSCRLTHIAVSVLLHSRHNRIGAAHAFSTGSPRPVCA